MASRARLAFAVRRSEKYARTRLTAVAGIWARAITVGNNEAQGALVIAPAIRNLFTRWLPHRQHAAEHQTDYQGLLEESPATLDGEYQRLIVNQLARWGVDERVVAVQVQQGGRRKKPVFSAVLTIQGWDRDAVLRVLVGLPLLEKKVRRAVADLWIADVSTFDGLLVRVSPRLQDTAACSELRQLLMSITGGRPQRVKAGVGGDDADATLA